MDIYTSEDVLTRTALNCLRNAHTRWGCTLNRDLPAATASSDGDFTVNVNSSPLEDSAANVSSQLTIFSMLALFRLAA